MACRAAGEVHGTPILPAATRSAGDLAVPERGVLRAQLPIVPNIHLYMHIYIYINATSIVTVVDEYWAQAFFVLLSMVHLCSKTVVFRGGL